MSIRSLATCLLMCVVFAIGGRAFADVRTYDFDDGTWQGWEYVNIDNEPYPLGDDELTDVGWKVSLEDVDLGQNGWNLLQGTSELGIGEAGAPQRVPNHRIIPEPWDNRDCLGSNECQTQVLKSPVFQLDDSGPISVDIMGGQGRGGRPFDEMMDTAPGFFDDHEQYKSSSGSQGFGLFDVAADEYVRWAFPSFNNDGKERDGRDVWETVQIPVEDLAELAGDGKDYRVDIFDSFSGGWGWIGFDTVRIPDASFVGQVAVPGDCNNDGVLDAGDLACITSVEQRDVVLGGLNTLPGDFDGNGDVAFADFLVLSSSFGTSVSGYTQGDIDVNGKVEFADFLVLSANFGNSATAAAVPEPNAGILLMLGLIAGLAARRSRD